MPHEFTLGSGHVKFFYDKLEYLWLRYQALRGEALQRGFRVDDFSEAWQGVPPELMNGYIERGRDRELIIQRIQERGFTLKKNL
jgi:deoxyribonuclease (pyrimidine dimer)